MFDVFSEACRKGAFDVQNDRNNAVFFARWIFFTFTLSRNKHVTTMCVRRKFHAKKRHKGTPFARHVKPTLFQQTAFNNRLKAVRISSSVHIDLCVFLRASEKRRDRGVKESGRERAGNNPPSVTRGARVLFRDSRTASPGVYSFSSAASIYKTRL